MNKTATTIHHHHNNNNSDNYTDAFWSPCKSFYMFMSPIPVFFVDWSCVCSVLTDASTSSAVAGDDADSTGKSRYSDP